jgi:hypothetical protein
MKKSRATAADHRRLCERSDAEAQTRDGEVQRRFDMRRILSEGAKRRARSSTYQTCCRRQRASSCCQCCLQTWCYPCCCWRQRYCCQCSCWSQSLSLRRIRHGSVEPAAHVGQSASSKVKVARRGSRNQRTRMHLPPVELLLLLFAPKPPPPKPLLWLLLLLEPKPPPPPKPKDMLRAGGRCARGAA